MDRSGFETGVRLYGPRLSVQTRPDEEDPTAVMHYAVATSRGVVMLDELDTEKLQMAGDDPTLIMARYVEYVGTARYLGCGCLQII